jgi:hypothetical protein
MEIDLQLAQDLLNAIYVKQKNQINAINAKE